MDGKYVIVYLYVDDLLKFILDIDLVNDIKSFLCSNFDKEGHRRS